MKVQELFEAKETQTLNVSGFLDADSMKKLWETIANFKAEVKKFAADCGVKAKVTRVDDKDLPGYDLEVSGPEQGVAKMFQKFIMKKGSSLKAALEFARSQE